MSEAGETPRPRLLCVTNPAQREIYDAAMYLAERLDLAAFEMVGEPKRFTRSQRWRQRAAFNHALDELSRPV